MMQVSKKIRCGIVGCTGMVGQRFALLLNDHPYFEITVLAASGRSAGKTYTEALGGRWKMQEAIPEKLKDMPVLDGEKIDDIKGLVDFIFCAIDATKEQVLALEEAYARAEIPVISNDKANRWTPDVPMLIPEINHEHIKAIEHQKARLGTKKGFIAVKPNCSIQSYVPLITPLLCFEPTNITVCTYQAISGASKTFSEFPEILDNVIPYIGGEEEKSEKEPMRIWGSVVDGEIVCASEPAITAQCLRVPVLDGHMAAVFIKFAKKPTREQILAKWEEFNVSLEGRKLPSSPDKFITYFEEDNRPQTKLDRDLYNGMGISAGRLREDNVYDFKFIGLSHNTLRGAAGGGVLAAELLAEEGYIY